MAAATVAATVTDLLHLQLTGPPQAMLARRNSQVLKEEPMPPNKTFFLSSLPLKQPQSPVAWVGG
jgi:hypothetical protein